MVPLIVLGTAILIGGIFPSIVMDPISSGVSGLLAQLGTIQMGGIF